MDPHDDLCDRDRYVLSLAFRGIDLLQKREIIAVILVLICSGGTILAVFTYDRFRDKPGEIELLALEPQKGNWTPQTVRVSQGKETTLVIRNVDVVTHGFYLPGLNIQVNEIRAGQSKTLQLLPKHQGEFSFYCTVWCSDHHMQMRGKLIVQ